MGKKRWWDGGLLRWEVSQGVKQIGCLITGGKINVCGIWKVKPNKKLTNEKEGILVKTVGKVSVTSTGLMSAVRGLLFVSAPVAQ